VCGSSARTDLYGGRSAMIVPTVTGTITACDGAILRRIIVTVTFRLSLGLFRSIKRPTPLDVDGSVALPDARRTLFRGRTEFPLMRVACTLALAQNGASHLWMLSEHL
jgi:hypothetical protein